MRPILSLAMLCSLLSAEPPSPSLTRDATCIRVIDGDTILCQFSYTAHVRLIDCWAPESRTKNAIEKSKGLKSKARLQQLALGQDIRVQIPIGEDVGNSTTLSRVLGRAWLADGRELSEIMVSEGLATKTKTLTDRR